jgi:hypothetical protein
MAIAHSSASSLNAGSWRAAAASPASEYRVALIARRRPVVLL